MELQLFHLLFLCQLAFIVGHYMDFEEKQMWIEQKLDHFNKSDNRTWQMQYLASDTFFKPGGPIIINVNGEWELEAKSGFFGMVYEMVEILNAYIFETEHRYYGRSWPVKDLSTENLVYLTANQALADLAHFIRYQKATIPALANSKVIMVGCSYAGNLVTYFRKDYPDLIDGGWAAGAGLIYTVDYSDAYVSVGKTLRKVGGDACYDIVNHFSKSYLIHRKNADAVYVALKAQNLTYSFEEIQGVITTHVQHRNRTGLVNLCKNLTSYEKNDILGFAKLIKVLRDKTHNEEPYSNSNLQLNAKHASRQHNYQSCSEFGGIFSTSSNHQPFGKMQPLGVGAALCKELFGPQFTLDYISDRVDEINAKYGGSRPNVDHIYFTKAEDDPWRYMGIDDECATIVPGIGHCKELRERKPNDLPTTTAAQLKAIDLMRDWINGNGTTRETLIKC